MRLVQDHYIRGISESGKELRFFNLFLFWPCWSHYAHGAHTSAVMSGLSSHAAGLLLGVEASLAVACGGLTEHTSGL